MERIKLQFKGTPEARAESFLHYAYEHGHEVEEAVNAEAEAKLARELARHDAMREEPEWGPATPIDDPSIDPAAEMRAWVGDNLGAIAEAFGVASADVAASVAGWQRAHAEAVATLQGELDRARLTVAWGAEGASVDLAALCSVSLPVGGAAVFVGPGWYVAAPLVRLVALLRHDGARAIVDAAGITVAWPGGSARVVPMAVIPPSACCLHLPPAPYAVAA